MYLIECKKDLKPHWIEEFIQKAGGNDVDSTLIFEMNNDVMFESKLGEIRKNYFEDANVAAIVMGMQRNDAITIVAGETALRFAVDDYNWWTATLRRKPFARLDELFGVVPARVSKDTVNHDENDRNAKARATLSKSQRKSQNAQTYKIAAGIKKDNTVTDIEKFEGNEKQMRDFVNKLFARNHLRTFGKGVTVYCVNYQYDDDLNHIDNWKTISQLTAEGVFKK